MDHPVVQALALVAVLGASLATPVKIIVDVIRRAAPSYAGMTYALLAFALGIAFSLLTLVSIGQFTMQQVATGIMAGVLAGAMAIGATEVGKSAQAKRDAYKQRSVG